MSQATAGMGQAGPVRPQRPRELQDGLNYYIYHPLAWQLARQLAKTPITPNMVSVLGACMVIAAGFVYTGSMAWPISAALGMALHMGWHVVDGADGDLARMTGRTSPIGEMVDGLCDYLSHAVLYVLLALFMAGPGGFGTWQAWALVMGAGISHAVQSNHVEVQRRQYQYWVYGTPWLRNSHGSGTSATDRSWAAALVSTYIGVASGMTPHALKIDAAVEAATGNRARLDEVAAAVRTESPPLLMMCKVLGPNPRAVVLGLSMLIGAAPLWYLLYQVIVLNVLLVVSVMMHNAAARRIAAKIGA